MYTAPRPDNSRNNSQVHVTYDDQKKINLFGRLNSRYQELEVEFEQYDELEKKAQDATEEMYLSEELYYVVGDMFIKIDDEDEFEAMLKKREEKEKLEKRRREIEMGVIKEKMDSLKANLYSKFGRDVINLDMDRKV